MNIRRIFSGLTNIKTALLLFTFAIWSVPLHSQHGWSVNPPDFEYNSEYSFLVIMNSSEVSTGTLGAFVGEECRGFNDAAEFPVTGKWLFTLMCYSNESDGEMLSFKYYNPSDGLIYDISETLEFEANKQPDRLNPYELHVITSEPPVVTDIPGQSVYEGSTFATINLDDYVSDPDNPDSELTWEATGQSELTVSIVSRVATITIPDADWYGSETITFTATDPDGLSDSDDATFTVIPVNDPPGFTTGGNQTVLEDAGPQSVANWATNISPGPSNESSQTVTFNVTNNNNSLFSVQPGISSDGTLTYTPAPDANGSATVTVTLSDDGGTANGGDDTSDPQTFTITVTAVNDPPGFTAGSNQTVPEDAGPQSVVNWATNISPGPANESAQTVTFNVSNNNNSLFSVQPAISSSGTLTYTPAANAYGITTVTVSLSDNGGTANGGQDTSGEQTFTITVTAVNDPPVVGNIPDQSVPEGSSFTPINLDNYVHDVDNADSEITWTYSGNTELQVSIVNRIATITIPSAAWYGSETITFTATDPGALSDSDDATFTVSAVNDPPVVGDIPDQTIAEGSSFDPISLDDYVEDNEDPDSDIIWTFSGNSALIVSIVNRIATITTPDEDWNGSETITFTATDQGGLSNSDDATFTVTPVNDAPVVSGIPDQTIPEGSTFTSINLDNYVSDVDNADNEISWVATGNSELTVSIVNRVATIIIPDADWYGYETITFTATDPGGLSDSDDATFTVTPVNDPPVFTAGANQTVLEDAGPQSVPGWATNISAGPPNESSQTLTFNVTNNNNTLFSAQPAISSTGTLTYTPAANANGIATVTVILRDDGGTANGGIDSSDPQTFAITVTAVNDPPGFTAGANQTILEDAGAHTVINWATNISAGPANEASQTLTFIVSNNNNALFSAQPAVSSTGTLTYTPAANANGIATVTVTLRDNGGTANGGIDTSDPQTFTITVTPVNDPPSFAAGGNQTVLEDAGPRTVTNWATAISAGPANEASQTVTFMVINNNNALFSVQPAVSPTGTLTYTPAPDANGIATVTVTLSDDGGTANGGNDTSAPQTFTITVTAVNDPPSFTAGPNQTVPEDAGPQTVINWATNISAGPPDESSQQLTFFVSNNNSGLFSAQPAVTPTGTLTYTPAPDAHGNATVTVFLRDDGGTANGGNNTSPNQTFLITVTPVNDPPVLVNPVDDQVLDEHFGTHIIDLANVFMDPDGTTPTLSASSSNLSVVTVSVSGTILTITETGLGTSTITITASDGTLTATDNFLVTVIDVNDPPVVINPIPDRELNEHFGTSYVNLNNVFSDPDGDVLTLSALSDNALVVTVTIEGNTLVITETGPGIANITVTANDGEYSVNDVFRVTVLNVNDPPVVANPIPDLVLEEYFGIHNINISEVFFDPDGDVLAFTATSSDIEVVTVSVSGNTLTITETGLGISNITLTANDGEFTSSDQFLVTVLNVNEPPVVVNPILDEIIDEGFGSFTIDLSTVFSDPDAGDVLTYSAVSSDPGVVTVSVSGSILTITETGLGTSDITVTASDGEFSVNDVFKVSVNDVNLPPVMTCPSIPVYLNEGFGTHTIYISDLVTDPDGDELSIVVTSSHTAVVTVTKTTTTIVIHEVENGSSTINLSAFDGFYTRNCSFTVTVNDVNDPPLVANPIPDLNLNEHFGTHTINLSQVFIDPDSDPMTFTAVSSHTGVVTVSVSGSVLTITEQGIGTSNITVTASDAEFDTEEYFTVTVIDVNEPPYVANPLPDLNLEEHFGTRDVSLTGVFFDPEGDVLTYTANSSNPGVVTVSVSGTTLTVTEAGPGTANITVTARDAEFSASDQFQVTVVDVNDPPVVNNPINNQYLLEGFGTEMINLSGVFYDPDGDPMTFTAVSSNTGVVTVSVSGATLSITEQGIGTSEITITASDGQYSVDDEFTVIVSAGNRAPVVAEPISSRNYNEGFGTATVDLSEVFTDPDEDPLTLSASSGNTNVVTVSVTNTTLTIYEAGIGTATITLTANDGLLSTNSYFEVTVSEMNHPPVVDNPIADVSYNEGFGSRDIDLSAVFSDPDDDVIFLSASSGNEAVVTVAVNGTTLTITEVGTGTSTVTVTASDGALSTNETFDVTVLDVNEPPVVANPIADREYYLSSGNHTILLTNTFFDPDGDELTFSATSSNESVVIAEVNGVTLNLTIVGTGSTTITVTADDGKSTVSDTFKIDVIKENLLQLFYNSKELHDSDTVTICNEADSIDFVVRSDIEWNVSTTTFWISTSKPDDSILRIKYSRNPTNNDRRGSVSVQDDQDHFLIIYILQTKNCGPNSADEQWDQSGLRVYPNPVKQSLNINLQGLDNRNVTVEILDPGGRMMHQSNYPLNRHDLIQVDVSHYIEGLYFVRIHDGTGMIVRKVIKQ